MNAITSPEIQTMTAVQIREQFAQKRLQGLRAKDAAEALQLSEGAVIAAHGGEHERALQALPLRAEWLDILKALEACGPVMALTRNESTVHEKDGIYQNVSAQGPVGLALSREIDLRLFFMHWHAGFAVTEESANGGRPAMRSLQFYDAAGRAVHKVFAREGTDMAAWNALVERFAEPSAGYVFREPAAKPAIKADAQIDVPALSQAWTAMKDTHEFFEMLRRFGAERQQAFRLVPQYCERLSTDAVAAAAGRCGGGRRLHHGVCGQQRLHPDPHRPREQYSAHGRQGWRALDQCAGQGLQPASAHRPDRPCLGGAQTHQRWRGDLGRGL